MFNRRVLWNLVGSKTYLKSALERKTLDITTYHTEFVCLLFLFSSKFIFATFVYWRPNHYLSNSFTKSFNLHCNSFIFYNTRDITFVAINFYTNLWLTLEHFIWIFEGSIAMYKSSLRGSCQNIMPVYCAA